MLQNPAKNKTEKKGLDLNPESVQAGRFQKGLELDKLDQYEKQLLWRHLKKEHPKKAEQLKILFSDSNVQNLISQFQGTVVLEPIFVPLALKQYLK